MDKETGTHGMDIHHYASGGSIVIWNARNGKEPTEDGNKVHHDHGDIGRNGGSDPGRKMELDIR